jgi:hypothetical protein
MNVNEEFPLKGLFALGLFCVWEIDPKALNLYGKYNQGLVRKRSTLHLTNTTVL